MIKLPQRTSLVATLIAFAFVLLLSPVSRAAPDRVAEASSGQSAEPGDLVLLPLDDYSIPWRNNLKVTLRAPDKYPGNPVMGPGPAEAPDGYGPKMYGTVLRQGGKLRMWYLACPRTDPRLAGDLKAMTDYHPVAYAESADGIRWERPDLGLVDFRGSKHNNLVLIEPGGESYARCLDFVAVYFDPSDPDPGQRYKMAYITRDLPLREGSTATCVSPDGLRWRLANTTMFTKGHFENTSLIKHDGLYYLAGQNLTPYDGSDEDGSNVGRVMKVFFSPDFRHWSDERALAFYRSDYQRAAEHFGQETHMGAGLWDRGNVVLGVYGRWHGNSLVAHPAESARFVGPDELKGKQGAKVGLKGLTIELGFVVSNDAIHYREPARNFIFATYGPPDAWDSDAILQANAFANTDTQTYIWYSHSAIVNNQGLPRVDRPLARDFKPPSVGLLTLPRDRFGAFGKLAEVSEERNPAFDHKREASCLTRSLRLERPSRLFANLDGVSERAPLRIAIVDDAERPFDGYTGTLEADSLKTPVAWAGSSPTLPVGRNFRIKVSWPEDVNEARLYALYVEHE